MDKRLIWHLLIIIVTVFSCKTDFSRQPVVSTGYFDLAGAIAHGTLVDQGANGITDHGFCWDSAGNPNLGNQTIHLGPISKAGNFQALISTLSANKTYFLKAFILYRTEALYGEMITFTTPDLPVLNTDTVSETTENFAVCGGNISSDNGSPVLVRGGLVGE